MVCRTAHTKYILRKTVIEVVVVVVRVRPSGVFKIRQRRIIVRLLLPYRVAERARRFSPIIIGRGEGAAAFGARRTFNRTTIINDNALVSVRARACWVRRVYCHERGW